MIEKTRPPGSSDFSVPTPHAMATFSEHVVSRDDAEHAPCDPVHFPIRQPEHGQQEGSPVEPPGAGKLFARPGPSVQIVAGVLAHERPDLVFGQTGGTGTGAGSRLGPDFGKLVKSGRLVGVRLHRWSSRSLESWHAFSEMIASLSLRRKPVAVTVLKSNTAPGRRWRVARPRGCRSRCLLPGPFPCRFREHGKLLEKLRKFFGIHHGLLSVRANDV